MLGFATQCALWAQHYKATPQACELASRLGSLLTDALENGDTCVLLDELQPSVDKNQLRQTAIVAVADQRGALQEDPLRQYPLTLFQNHLYLSCYFAYEYFVAARILALSHRRVAAESSIAAISLDGYSLQQQAAIRLALTRGLCLLSGGPGTGKTRVIAGMVAALRQQRPEINIQLAAPTGKAARRMAESLAMQGVSLLSTPRTLHATLGIMPGKLRPKYHQANLLHLDVLIVDEASMLDLTLAYHLLAALPPKAQLILIGDRNQLDAVESGVVFSALMSVDSWRDCSVVLDQNFRFSADSALGQMATMVLVGDSTAALSLFNAAHADEVRWLDEQDRRLSEEIRSGFQPFQQWLQEFKRQPLSARQPEADSRLPELFAALNSFRLLCVHRVGPRGIVQLNRQVAALLHPKLMDYDNLFDGCPVIIGKNDATLALSNGDVGICLRDSQGELRVMFADQIGFRSITPAQLPPYDWGYALTVHRAQGSEFQKVCFVLPNHESPLVSRELIYTAITRSQSQLLIYGERHIFVAGINQSKRRRSGLVTLLQHQIALTQKNHNSLFSTPLIKNEILN